MGKWDKIAKDQFMHMPDNFQKDWDELRKKVDRNK